MAVKRLKRFKNLQNVGNNTNTPHIGSRGCNVEFQGFRSHIFRGSPLDMEFFVRFESTKLSKYNVKPLLRRRDEFQCKADIRLADNVILLAKGVSLNVFLCSTPRKW